MDATATSNIQPPEPYVREAGGGPGVVCLHANASTSGQWRGLMERIAPKFHVLAPDLYDSGKSPRWPSDSVITLRDEAALIEPVLARAGSPLTLVGHSYGGAVALIAAVENPERVRALVLYEPTLFSLIEAVKPAPNDADGIRHAVANAGAALDAGNRDAAAECFIDYWMWPGAWRAMPTERKAPIADSGTNVRRWKHALFNEPTPLDAFSRLRVPILYLIGERTTASARGVAKLLVPALRHVEVVELEGLGHMAPVTHPDKVNDRIQEFLERIG